MSKSADMLRFHREGLTRVSAVIDANPHYDDLLEYRITDAEKALYAPGADVASKRDHAVASFERLFRSRTHKIILPEFAGFACDGNTKNNLREFEFFERICSGVGIRIAQNNYAACDAIAFSKLGDAERAAMDAVSTDVATYYGERGDISASLVRQLTLYSRSFFNFLLAFSRPGATLPVALVQANDHSPVRVALSMVMKGLGVPRIYLQHAEVTRSFPELDFEFSVLRNRQSREIYEAIGPTTGEVYVISRYEEPFARDRLAAERIEPVTVAIYPTSRVIVDELRKIVGALEGNAAVGRLIIKQHPGAAQKLQHVLSGSKLEVVEDFDDEDHIAIVGNSSVVIELLHRGVPVYQIFGFDPVQRDYYGFSGSGLTREIGMQDLASKFWHPYLVDGSWLKNYERWDPTAGDTYLQEQENFVADIVRLAERVGTSAKPRPMRGRLRARLKGQAKRGLVWVLNSNPRLVSSVASLALANSHRAANFLSVNSYRAASFLRAHTSVDIRAPIWSGTARTSPHANPAVGAGDIVSFLQETLCQLERPAEWLLRAEQVGTFGSGALIAALEALFEDRRPELRTVFEGFPTWPNGSAAGTWCYLKKVEWGNVALQSAELDAIAEFIYAYDGDAVAKSVLERSLFGALLRSGTLGQLDRFWQGAVSVRKSSLGVNHRIALVRKLRTIPGHEEEAERLLEQFKGHATPFELLKFSNMELLSGRSAHDWNHQKAEEQFERHAPQAISREYANHIRPVYDRLRARMQFMDARTNASEAKALLSLIENSLESGTPFSLMRLSDGEGYLFPGGRHFDANDVANRERHWWGLELSTEMRSGIIHQARQALASADVVGIPAIYRFIRDHGDGSRSLGQSIQGRGLLEVLQSVPEAISLTALIAEDKINVTLFADPDAVVSLARSARRLIIVGSVKAEHLPSALLDLQTEIILLPTHARTTLSDRYHAGTEPLPLVYEPLLEKLGGLAGPGALVLVAGGIIGKIFIGHARESGAVALDIGSVLDDWIRLDMATMR